MGEEATLNELMKQKEELTKERDAQVGQQQLMQHVGRMQHGRAAAVAGGVQPASTLGTTYFWQQMPL